MGTRHAETHRLFQGHRLEPADRTAGSGYPAGGDAAVDLQLMGPSPPPLWLYDLRRCLAENPARGFRRGAPRAGRDGLPISGRALASVPPEGNVIARSAAVGKWFESGWHARNEAFELRDNFTNGDPGFVAPENRDSRLRQESPVWKLGFRPIPMENIGLRADRDRRALCRRRPQLPE